MNNPLFLVLRSNLFPLICLTVACASHSACGNEPTISTTPWVWKLPKDLAPPKVPDFNPMTVESVELGKRLFFEKRLSLNQELACASCHEPALAFSINETTHRGATGDFTSRNAPSLANLAWASLLNWANLTSKSLEEQMLTPLFGDNPVEMGAGFVQDSSNHYDPQRLLELLEQEPTYERDFRRSFPEHPSQEPISWSLAINAIANFERSLVSLDSPWDKWRAGDENAISPSAKRGFDLFKSERLGCSSCHAGLFFSLAFSENEMVAPINEAFRNTGLYFIENGPAAYWNGAITHYPNGNQGLGEFTQDPKDDGKHRIPSLRNVALTAPYMHDGSVPDLERVLEHYANGGRFIASGPQAGDGRINPNKDPILSGFQLTEPERADVLAFLRSLTDTRFVSQFSK